MRSALFFPLMVSALAVSAVAAPTQADKVADLVRAESKRCGQKLTLSQPLSLAASDVYRGMHPDDALRKQGYRPHGRRSMGADYYGNLAWLKTWLSQSCSKWSAYSEFGLVTDGQRLYLIFSTPAQVDLSQRRRWLDEFLAATNKARFQGQKCGGQLMNAAPPLRWDSRLEAAAAKHAQDMTALNFRGHINPKDGTNPRQRAENYGFRGSVGENIHYGGVTPQEAVKSLLGSPEHCKNLMKPRWTLFGAAVANGSTTTLFPTYWVQVFGLEP